MFLARTVEHTTDVDGMLERIGTKQFEEWQDYYSSSPWGDDWGQAGMLASVIHNELVNVKSLYTGKHPKGDEYTDPDDYIPRIKPKRQKPKKSRKKQLQESFIVLRQQAGV